jgi:hypothetical protein
MPYALLIGLGAGLVSAVVFASATTGPLLTRTLLFILTPLPLFLAGLGLRPVTAAVAGLSGTVLLVIAGGTAPAVVFAASQAIPVLFLIYLASLHRDVPGGTQWYPVGRIVLIAALIAGTLVAAMLLLLGGDIDVLRTSLRTALDDFVTNELPKLPDAPTLGPKDLDELTAVALALGPPVLAMWMMGSLLLNMWLAGRITLASGRLQRPWPDLAAMSFPPLAPLLLATATGAGFLSGMPGLIAAGFAGPLFFAYVLLGLAVVHFVTRGRPWRPFALWALYVTLFVMNTFASMAIALLGLAESVWPIRKLNAPPEGPPNA